MDNLEYQNINDKFYNFGSNEYKPLSKNLTNKIKSNNIILNSIENTIYKDSFLNLKKSLNNNLGVDKVTWGIKNINGDIEWELYFYNELFSDVSVKKSISIVDKHFKLQKNNDDVQKYFMWSFDINSNLNKKINFYSSMSNSRITEYVYAGGKVYSYDNGIYSLENTYTFWRNSMYNINKIYTEINNSPFINEHFNINDVLIPEFLNWYKNNNFEKCIVTSNKRQCDSIYYMSLDVNMLLLFLNKFNYPKKQINFIESNKDKLNHLLYDISINYKMDGTKFKVLKSGYYGQI